MAINTTPIFTLYPKAYGVKGAYTVGTYGGAMNDGKQIWVAGGNGSYVQKIRFKSLATSTATVARIWINNGGSEVTTTNNFLYDEITIPATVGGSATAGSATYEVALNLTLKPAYKLFFTFGGSIGNTVGFDVLTFGGDY